MNNPSKEVTYQIRYLTYQVFKFWLIKVAKLQLLIMQQNNFMIGGHHVVKVRTTVHRAQCSLTQGALWSFLCMRIFFNLSILQSEGQVSRYKWSYMSISKQILRHNIMRQRTSKDAIEFVQCCSYTVGYDAYYFCIALLIAIFI